MNPKYLLLALLLLLSGASHAATYINNSTGTQICCGTNCTLAVARTLLGVQTGDCTDRNSTTTKFYSGGSSGGYCTGTFLGLHSQSTAPCRTCTALQLKDGTCVADQAGAAAVGSTPSAPGDIPGTDDNGEETPPVCSPGAGLGKLICKNGWVFQCESSTSVSGGENGSSETCAYGPCVRTSAQCNPYTPSGGCRENEKAIGAGCVCAPGATRVNGVCKYSDPTNGDTGNGNTGGTGGTGGTGNTGGDTGGGDTGGDSGGDTGNTGGNTGGGNTGGGNTGGSNSGGSNTGGNDSGNTDNDNDDPKECADGQCDGDGVCEAGEVCNGTPGDTNGDGICQSNEPCGANNGNSGGTAECQEGEECNGDGICQAGEICNGQPGDTNGNGVCEEGEPCGPGNGTGGNTGSNNGSNNGSDNGTGTGNGTDNGTGDGKTKVDDSGFLGMAGQVKTAFEGMAQKGIDAIKGAWEGLGDYNIKPDGFLEVFKVPEVPCQNPDLNMSHIAPGADFTMDICGNSLLLWLREFLYWLAWIGTAWYVWRRFMSAEGVNEVGGE